MAREVLDRYHDLDAAGRLSFFETLARDFGPDRERLSQAIESLARAAERRRRQRPALCLRTAAAGTDPPAQPRAGRHQRRWWRCAPICLAPDEGQQGPCRARPRRRASAVFLVQQGILVLRRIDWSTPANILEQIIRYEAVHEIRDWNDLRRRIDPGRPPLLRLLPSRTGRRAPDLRRGGADRDRSRPRSRRCSPSDRQPVPIERARTAVFYSISNTQRGLGGISFGSFLIKQVVEELRRELPKLENFVTLSPVPGFMQWLKQAERCSGLRRGSGAARSPRQARLVRECGADRATARRCSSRWRRIIS